jgi:hypothetical protein
LHISMHSEVSNSIGFSRCEAAAQSPSRAHTRSHRVRLDALQLLRIRTIRTSERRITGRYPTC